MKIKTVFTLLLLSVLLLNLSLQGFAEDESKKVEKDNWRFIGEVSGGVIGAVIGSLIVRVMIPSPSEGGLGGWGQGVALTTIWYVSSLLLGIPLGSTAGVTLAGKMYGYESDFLTTLQGSYVGVAGGLFTPFTIITSPLNAAEYFDSRASKIGTGALTMEAKEK